MKKLLLICALSLLILPGCTPKGENPDKDFDKMYNDGDLGMEEKINDLNKPVTVKNMDDEQLAGPEKGDTIATIKTNHGTIKFRFFPEAAPELSKNFQELAKKSYYDGVIFHRVIKGFMIQGGDPLGNGTGGESYKGTGLADEPGALALKHHPGAVACAKSSLPNSIGSQFYIVHEQARFLDGNYSVFGQVFEGMDVVNKIANLETDAGDKPLEDVTMESVTIGTFEG